MSKIVLSPAKEARQTKRHRYATFIDADQRLAVIEGRVYPVLFSSFTNARDYEEDMLDEDLTWCRAFTTVIKRRDKVILASDIGSASSYTFLGLFSVSNVHLTNNLTCRFKKCISKVSTFQNAGQ